MPKSQETFAIKVKVSSEVLASLRALAQKEGRQLQALVDEALADVLEKRGGRTVARTSWAHISRATKSMALFTRSSLSDPARPRAADWVNEVTGASPADEACAPLDNKTCPSLPLAVSLLTFCKKWRREAMPRICCCGRLRRWTRAMRDWPAKLSLAASGGRHNSIT